MYKALVFAAFATLTLAQDFPKPIVPSEYTSEVINWDYPNYKPNGYWSIERKSSKMNKIYLGTGKTDGSGNKYLDFVRVTDGNTSTEL